MILLIDMRKETYEQVEQLFQILKCSDHISIIENIFNIHNI